MICHQTKVHYNLHLITTCNLTVTSHAQFAHWQIKALVPNGWVAMEVSKTLTLLGKPLCPVPNCAASGMSIT